MMGHHNLTLKLMWFAIDNQWRVYTDSGHYAAASSIEDLPYAIRLLLRTSAESALRSLSDETDK